MKSAKTESSSSSVGVSREIGRRATWIMFSTFLGLTIRASANSSVEGSRPSLWVNWWEVRILQLRYGLHDGQSYTLEEVGRKMGVTRERVRQIEAQALSRLRHPSHRRKLADYLRE